MRVVEHCRTSEGQQIKRGIFRDFPTRYDNHRGITVVVPFEVLNVQRDGAAEPYKVEPMTNGMRVRIGNAQQMLPHGQHMYRISYRTGRQLGFFDQHDELYWNVTGNGWAFVIDRASARFASQVWRLRSSVRGVHRPARRARSQCQVSVARASSTLKRRALAQ